MQIKSRNFRHARCLAALIPLVLLHAGCNRTQPAEPTVAPAKTRAIPDGETHRVFTTSHASGIPAIVVWWEGAPDEVKAHTLDPRPDSNIHPNDYVGPDACQKCHKEIYESWSHHSHRWMNALADETTVKGDFDSGQTISYRGGTGDFYREGGQFRMRLSKDGVQHVYRITQTIGSRFFQYYVGRLLEGPEPPSHRFYTEDHVLPFGYWLDRKEWLPTVHVGEEVADNERPNDPYHPTTTPGVYAPYSHACNYCHTTFPLGDLLVRNPPLIGRHAPRQLHLELADYLRDAHPELLTPGRPAANYADAELDQIFDRIAHYGASEQAVTLGISCESCHLGGRQHASQELKKPRFFPHSPHLRTEKLQDELNYGRTNINVNWACGRCHAGERPYYAAGIATWNSVEYSDAMRGGCYSELRCVDCHNPHQTIGKKWSRTATQDDAICLRCHDKFAEAITRQQHTHHPAGSAGDRCMNCHMPRINEGLQNIVRTHTIFSPTNREMIEANQPNACNVCHTRESINWTADHLFEWYGASYDLAAYADRDAPVAQGWLKHDFQAVRMVGADALTRTGSRWALAELLDALDDTFMTNRQFALIGIERMLGIDLQDFGYRHYMTATERQAPIEQLKQALLPAAE